MSIIGRLALGAVKSSGVPLILFGVSWIGGARYGAPVFYVDAIDSGISWVAEKVFWTAAPANQDAPSTEEIDKIDDEGRTPIIAAATPQEGLKTVAPAVFTHASADTSDLLLCNMKISNAPNTNANGVVAKAGATVSITGVSLLKAPVTQSCFSSGFGYRGYSPHRGADYFSDHGGSVLAAGDGKIIEAEYRADYGNTIVVDHDGGVYTRYAHLGGFEHMVKVGASVKRGQILGPIGHSGSAGAKHLHYEVRTGNYTNPKKYWGLTPVDPLSGKSL